MKFRFLLVLFASAAFADDLAAPKYFSDKKGVLLLDSTEVTAATDTAPAKVRQKVDIGSGSVSASSAGSGTIASGQQALSTSSTQVVAASATRQSVCVRNHDATISIYVGATGVTTSTGILIKAGESITIHTAAAVFAVAASGTPTAGYLTESN